MISLATYLGLFAIGVVPVVLVTSFLTHADDPSALKDLPRRIFVFAGSCLALAVALVAIGAYVG
ncbi:MAG: hypothetical protein AAFZ65_12920 [Planctomycetota bacterium]